MAGNLKKEDLRIVKTHKALLDAMSSLLKRRNFGQITVNDLCMQAQISRTTFYAHFDDKYDLLKYWLTNSKIRISGKEDLQGQIKEVFDHFANNAKVIKNVVEDANGETLELLHRFMVTLLDIDVKEKDDVDLNIKRDILSVFCSGGMVNFLAWQAKGKPECPQAANGHFCEMLRYILNWRTDIAD